MSATRQSWQLRVLLEGGVIVCSILLAFSLDAWWEGRTNRVELDSMLRLLGQEVAENRNALANSISLHREVIAQIDSTISAGSHLGFGVVVPLEVFEASAGVLETMQATNLLTRIEDAELQIMLVTWSRLRADLAEKEATAADRREAIRLRIAEVGDFRTMDFRESDPNWTDRQVLNLIEMRRNDEIAAAESGQRLLDHMERISERLAIRP